MKPVIPPYQQGSSFQDGNRANQTRRDNDIVVTPKIDIYDIDYAILYHLQTNANLIVEEKESVIRVPVIYSNGETWSQIRQQGYLRDGDKLQSPILALKRDSINKDDRIPLLDFDNAAGRIKLYPYRTFNMHYDRKSGQYNTKRSYEYYIIPIPKYVRPIYSGYIWTTYNEQMNHVLEKLSAIDNHMWGDSYKFRTVVEFGDTETINIPGEDRVVRTPITLTVDGKLINEYKYSESEMQKRFSLKRIHVINEKEEHEFYVDNEPTNLKEDTHISEELRNQQNQNLKRNI